MRRTWCWRCLCLLPTSAAYVHRDASWLSLELPNGGHGGGEAREGPFSTLRRGHWRWHCCQLNVEAFQKEGYTVCPRFYREKLHTSWKTNIPERFMIQVAGWPLRGCSALDGLWMDLREATLVCSHFGKLLLLSRFSRVQLCVTPQTAAHQAPPSLGFSRQEHWSGVPFPSPMHESEKWKWSHSVVSDSLFHLGASGHFSQAV